MNSKLFFILAVAVTALFLAACGGASETGEGIAISSTATTQPSTSQNGTPEIKATSPKPGVDNSTSPSGTGVSTPAPTAAVGNTSNTAEASVAIDRQAFDIQTIMAEALSSPALLACLASKMDMQELFALADRAPTDEERALLLPCLADSGGIVGSQPISEHTPATPTPTPPPQTILAQALASPGLMWCLADNVGMDVLVDLESRSPSSQEYSAIRSCASDTREIAAWNAEWPKRLDAAFTPSTCGTAPTTNFPASYYQGPIIDTHLHIPQLPDDQYGEQDTGYVAPRGAESDKYDTISQEQRPLLGRTMNIDRIACTLQNEGSVKAFAFFPVFPEITSQAIEVASRAHKQYPDLFVPFIQASSKGMATLEGKILDVMLDVEPGLFAGFGEVGDSPTESINPLPDSEIYTGDFQVVENHGKTLVYFHPGEGHQDNLERALQQFSDVTFIIHADFVRPHVKGIMDRNPNVYYTYNDIFGISGEVMETFRFGEKERFIADMRAEWDNLLDEAVALYRPMIEAHPDKFMWGTDRGDIVWGYDEEVGQILVEFGRAFIGRFDPAIQ
ncbi:MAG: hypothetical protein H8E48_15185, partial [Chloroflexi bacterium]|nr:hypothetical protein [Chloroflexota bacterium]